MIGTLQTKMLWSYVFGVGTILGNIEGGGVAQKKLYPNIWEKGNSCFSDFIRIFSSLGILGLSVLSYYCFESQTELVTPEELLQSFGNTIIYSWKIKKNTF